MAGPPAPASPRVDYVDGAIEPILMRGQVAVIEGFGFGAAPGGVAFAGSGGGTAPAPVAAWSDLAIRITVPDGAVSGTVAVTTAAARRLTATVHVLARVPTNADALTWQARTAFPSAPIGVGVAAAEVPAGGVLTTTLYAAGGAEQIGPSLVPDSGVYLARAQPGGTIGAWTRQRDRPEAARSRVLPTPRAFAAVAVATRHNSRFAG
ncbi:MAG TPA: hypothetical protein VFX28_21265, partial [Methylomirabilota bacterium]|nr:hypothetical protein [Methylomirabilota bacterium]